MKKAFAFLALFVCISHPASAAEAIKPVGANGQPLNLDFETGTLKDWLVEGTAFDKQPVRGDTVDARRTDMKSAHEGNFWVGSFERGGDAPKGTLTSVAFKVTQPYASFLVAGGSHENTGVQLVRADTQKVVFKASGANTEDLRPVVADLREHVGKEIIIRLVDQESGGWGHINFDNFQFHTERPNFTNELNLAAAKAAAMPPPDIVKFSGLTAQEAAEAITLPSGFKANLFAGEPDVKQPIAFAIDDRGRLWVAEGFTYPIRVGNSPSRPIGQTNSEPTADELKSIFNGKDRIIVLEDTDGDGKFNKRTVFMEKLNLVSGIEIGFGGIWIGAAPYLMHVPVTDWDNPKPAGDPRILLDGWDYKRDTHETLNTFTWGPDGWLYGCHGVFCPSLVGKPGAPESERQWMDAGVWRYHPTKHIFEVFAEGTSNPWGVDFDERGQCWIEACVIPHLFHMIQGGRYHRQGGEHFAANLDETARNERHRDRNSRKPLFPYVYEDIKTVADHLHYAGDKGPHAGNARSGSVGGGHAHAGLMVYQGTNWPAEYRGKLYMNNIHGARINMDIPERAGSGFVGRHGKDFLLFNDKWSQVLNMLEGPDGAVYMIDWYDKNECHHNDPNGHDQSNGRIFRISYGDVKFPKVDLQKSSDEELIRLAVEQGDWYGRHARRILQERFAGTSLNAADRISLQTKLINDLFKRSSGSQRLRALWTIHCTSGFWPLKDQNAYLKQNEDASDEFVRAWAIQLRLEQILASAQAYSLIKPFSQEILRLAREDKSPVVRRYLASTLQRLPIDDRWEIIEALSQRAEDASDHNLPLLVWYAAEPLTTKDAERALKLAENSKLPKLLNFTVRRTAALNTPEAFAAISRSLMRVAQQDSGGTSYTSPKSPEPSGTRIARPSDQRTLDILSGLSFALKGQRQAAMPTGWAEVEAQLSASPNAEIRSLVQSLSLTFGSAKALASLKTTLMDPVADASARRMAFDSLQAARDASLPALLLQLLTDSILQSSALRGLASYDEPKTADSILAIYSSLGGASKRDALNTLASRAANAQRLLAAVDAGKIPRADLTADLVQQLRNLKNAEVDALLTKVWGVARDSVGDKLADIERYKQIYRAGGSQPGDAMRGRAIYAKVCYQCHTLFGTGGKVGPDLTGSNRGDLDYILQNIVDPNAVIPNEYVGWNIDTKDDRVITGLIKEQNDSSVTVATANETITIPRNEIAQMQQGKLSMMPEGLMLPLAEQEVRDLIYYLRQPGQTPLLATPDTVNLFFNGKDLSNWDGDTTLWSVENGEIVGKTTTGLKHNEFLKSQFVMSDFRLTFQVKHTPNTENSGVQFRSEPFEEYEMKGCQADIGKGWWGKVYEENGRALLSKVNGDAFVKEGDWNTYEILAVGPKIRTAINGNLCTDLDDPKVAARGIIGLQVHSGGPMEVRFKDFVLELNPKFELKTVK